MLRLPSSFDLSKTTDSAPLMVVSAATLSRVTSKSAVLMMNLSSNRPNLMPASYCSADSGAPIPFCVFSELKFAKWLFEMPK